jgi:hypothetical protein
MKHEIIKTENYLLVVDDSEIKEGELVLSKLFEIVHFGKNYTQSLYKKIIAHLPLEGQNLYGVDVLPSLEEDVEKLAKKHLDENHNNEDIAHPELYDMYNSFKSGYNKAKEKYKYTEEDMRGFHKFFMEIGTNSIYDALTLYIQSLSQPKIPIGFECQKEWVNSYESPTMQYDAQKLKPKTIINSQGQSVWVGEYIYA